MRRLLAVLALLLAAAPALADRQAAEFFAGRGEKALQAKDFAQAGEQYLRALQEDPSFHPARYGLAQALLWSGKPGEGTEALRKFAADVKGDPAAPAEWKALAARAEKQLQEADASGAEIQRIVDRYADDLTALARKWIAKDPVTAERAARRVLALRPGDRSAAEVLEKCGFSAKGPPVPLFNGADLQGWEQARFPVWQVVEGVLIGDRRDGASICWNPRESSGDFDVRVDARFVEERTGDPMLALLCCLHADYDYYCFGVLNRRVIFFEGQGAGKRRDIADLSLSETKAAFDVAGWNSFEVRMRGEEAQALVNGVVVARDRRPATRRTGFSGLYVQDARVAYRRLDVQPR